MREGELEAWLAPASYCAGPAGLGGPLRSHTYPNAGPAQNVSRKDRFPGTFVLIIREQERQAPCLKLQVTDSTQGSLRPSFLVGA